MLVEVRTIVCTCIGGYTLGLSTCVLTSNTETVCAAPWSFISKHKCNTKKTVSFYKMDPKHQHSVIVAEAQSAGYTIGKTQYGLIGKHHWNENNMNYAIISLFGTDPLPFIDTLSCHTARHTNNPITSVLHSKMIEWHSIQSHTYLRTDRSIVFWDLPPWDPRKYSSTEYIKRFGLPLYNGIILIINTKFRSNHAQFYKDIYDSIDTLISENDILKTHVPVYIVRTELEDDLIDNLHHKIDIKYHEYGQNNGTNWFTQWIVPEPILTRDEFMECLNDTIDEIKQDVCRVLDGYFYDNIGNIKHELDEHLFIVSTEWYNRMIATHFNGHGSSNGYHALLDVLKFYDADCEDFDGLIENHCISNKYVSQLYEHYVNSHYDTRHYVVQSIFRIATVVTAFVCARMVYRQGYRWQKTNVVGEK
eukprot:11874_1